MTVRMGCAAAGIVLSSDNEGFQQEACQLLDFDGEDNELGGTILDRLQVSHLPSTLMYF